MQLMSAAFFRFLVRVMCLFVLLNVCLVQVGKSQGIRNGSARERILINDGWKFMKYTTDPDKLIYDVRPAITDRNDNVVADSKPTEAVSITAESNVLKSWILPTANNFIKDPTKHHKRPAGNPGSDFPFVQSNFNDAGWESVNLPHDWAIKGPFYKGEPAEVGGGMGRLPSPGVAWYRRKLVIPATDKGKTIYLDIDGAMSYAMVWLNGTWPDRVGKITPVHVFTSGDEAELFLNDKSLGRKKKARYEYRFRWDSVIYEPGTVWVVTYKNGNPWANDTVRTAGAAASLQLEADRKVIKASGNDLSFITVKVLDANGNLAPEAANLITFEVVGAGELVATDNGDAANLEPFPLKERNAFSGLALAIIKGKKGSPGAITVTATAQGLTPATITIKTN